MSILMTPDVTERWVLLHSQAFEYAILMSFVLFSFRSNEKLVWFGLHFSWIDWTLSDFESHLKVNFYHLIWIEIAVKTIPQKKGQTIRVSNLSWRFYLFYFRVKLTIRIHIIDQSIKIERKRRDILVSDLYFIVFENSTTCNDLIISSDPVLQMHGKIISHQSGLIIFERNILKKSLKMIYYLK